MKHSLPAASCSVDGSARSGFFSPNGWNGKVEGGEGGIGSHLANLSSPATHDLKTRPLRLRSLRSTPPFFSLLSSPARPPSPASASHSSINPNSSRRRIDMLDGEGGAGDGGLGCRGGTAGGAARDRADGCRRDVRSGGQGEGGRGERGLGGDGTYVSRWGGELDLEGVGGGGGGGRTKWSIGGKAWNSCERGRFIAEVRGEYARAKGTTSQATDLTPARNQSGRAHQTSAPNECTKRVHQTSAPRKCTKRVHQTSARQRQQRGWKGRLTNFAQLMKSPSLRAMTSHRLVKVMIHCAVIWSPAALRPVRDI